MFCQIPLLWVASAWSQRCSLHALAHWSRSRLIPTVNFLSPTATLNPLYTQTSQEQQLVLKDSVLCGSQPINDHCCGWTGPRGSCDCKMLSATAIRQLRETNTKEGLYLKNKYQQTWWHVWCDTTRSQGESERERQRYVCTGLGFCCYWGWGWGTRVLCPCSLLVDLKHKIGNLKCMDRKKLAALIVHYWMQRKSVKQRRGFGGGRAGLTLHLVPWLATCSLRSPSWRSGCLGNQSLSRALAFQKE